LTAASNTRERGSRALQCAVDRGDRHIQALGRFCRGQAEDFGQEQRGALTRRQSLKRRDKREPDTLPERRELVWISGGRNRLSIRDRLEPMLAWKRFQITIHDALRKILDRTSAPRPARERVEADVRRDAVHPRAQRRATVESLEAAPRPHHRLLDRIVGVECGAEHPIAVAGDRGAVRFELCGVNGDVSAHAGGRILSSDREEAVRDDRPGPIPLPG